MRKFNRKNFETREISIQKNYVENSDGSCLICFGKTKVICTAVIENDILPRQSYFATVEYTLL